VKNRDNQMGNAASTNSVVLLFRDFNPIRTLKALLGLRYLDKGKLQQRILARDRIVNRRASISSRQHGVLTESYLLIREDRER
jgi:hypothetical protein